MPMWWERTNNVAVNGRKRKKKIIINNFFFIKERHLKTVNTSSSMKGLKGYVYIWVALLSRLHDIISSDDGPQNPSILFKQLERLTHVRSDTQLRILHAWNFNQQILTKESYACLRLASKTTNKLRRTNPIKADISTGEPTATRQDTWPTCISMEGPYRRRIYLHSGEKHDEEFHRRIFLSWPHIWHYSLSLSKQRRGGVTPMSTLPTCILHAFCEFNHRAPIWSQFFFIKLEFSRSLS